MGKTLSDTEKKSAANLRKEILALKTKLTDMGKDPDIAVGIAMKSLENRTKSNGGKYRPCYTTPCRWSRNFGIRVGMMPARLPHANAFRNTSKPVRNQDLA
ncbi:hypothetical protein BD293_1069 [Roseinatronobacter monicus]|uniref:Uncharacterized protein n=1 Tax=Roseinatronobacter monicus TaxID=393481 RepID=A0A543KBN4_9RHOB|nr:hypothetical protein BD293_1069 [Roseinatronobacter monicus]